MSGNEVKIIVILGILAIKLMLDWSKRQRGRNQGAPPDKAERTDGPAGDSSRGDMSLAEWIEEMRRRAEAEARRRQALAPSPVERRPVPTRMPDEAQAETSAPTEVRATRRPETPTPSAPATPRVEPRPAPSPREVAAAVARRAVPALAPSRTAPSSRETSFEHAGHRTLIVKGKGFETKSAKAPTIPRLNPAEARKAIIFAELLGPPKAKLPRRH